MAEYCLECLGKLDHTQYTERDFILSSEDDLDLCEGCSEWKRVVIVKRDAKLLYDLILPFRLIQKKIKEKSGK